MEPFDQTLATLAEIFHAYSDLPSELKAVARNMLQILDSDADDEDKAAALATLAEVLTPQGNETPGIDIGVA